MMMFAPYVFVAAASLAHPAAEPRITVEPSCRAASNLSLPFGQTFSQCMQDEMQARREVAKKWAGYRSAARSRCRAEVMIGGDPSYVDLLECLEMDKSLSGRNPRSHSDGADANL